MGGRWDKFHFSAFVMVCESVVVLDLGLLASRSDFEYSSNCCNMYLCISWYGIVGVGANDKPFLSNCSSWV